MLNDSLSQLSAYLGRLYIPILDIPIKRKSKSFRTNSSMKAGWSPWLEALAQTIWKS